MVSDIIGVPWANGMGEASRPPQTTLSHPRNSGRLDRRAQRRADCSFGTLDDQSSSSRLVAGSVG
jgi:hypothetical protein